MNLIFTQNSLDKIQSGDIKRKLPLRENLKNHIRKREIAASCNY